MKKSLVWILLIFTLIFSVSVAIPGFASPSPTKLGLDLNATGKPYLVDPDLKPGGIHGDTLTVDVYVTDVEDLYMFAMGMRWAGDVLDCQSIIEGPFIKSGGSTLFVPVWFNGPDEIGISDYLMVGITLFGAPQGVTGAYGLLCTINFQVQIHPNQTALDMYDTELRDTPGRMIDYDEEDGYFANGDMWALSGYPGDVNGDLACNVTDLMYVARAMGTDPRYPPGTDWHQWNPDCDFNNDLKVNAFDLYLVGVNYGQPRYTS